MDNNSATSRSIGVTQRAQIIQRILVDGWTPAQAAKTCGVEERRIARWVADYRRRGMASLRCDETTSGRIWRRMLIALQRLVPQASATMRQAIGRSDPAPCVTLRGGRDDALRR